MRLAILFVLVMATPVWAQDEPKKGAAKPVAPLAHGNVTRGEFWAAYGRMKSSADRVLGIEVTSGQKPSKPDALLTRSDVIVAFTELFDHFKPKFRGNTRRHPVVKDAIVKSNPTEIRTKIEKLVTWGFVAPVGPLVVGPGQNLDSKTVGEALGYFYNRLTILTHKAEPKWTPRLDPDGG